jgi:hypothetical protein
MEQSRLLSLIQLFKSVYSVQFNQGLFENYSDETFESIFKACKEIIQNINETEKILLKRRVDSEFQIYQPDPIAILNDYEHQSNWFTSNKTNYDLFYWNRYKQHLIDKDIAFDVVNKLDFKTTDQLIDLLGDPNESVEFARKGLVMGDVQSGKTSNYIGLICKAADVGYKVIILLTGTLESLRVQTQIRIEEGFIGYDVNSRKNVGVGKPGHFIPRSVTSRTNDFTGIAGQNTLLKIDNSAIPLIFVTKKNTTTLKKIKDTLSYLNIIPPQNKINSSVLIIDDEADNASVNTNDIDYDPTRINSEIRDLLNLFARSNYVGFTATPFANVFIDPESETEMLRGDLFPKDFIFSLDAPSNYFGPQKIFLNSASNFVITIKDDSDFFPLIHDKSWEGDMLFESLIDAIRAFILINVIRDLNEGSINNSHRSMLINISRFIKVQERIEQIVQRVLNSILTSINLTHGLDAEKALENNVIYNLHRVYLVLYKDFYSWDTIFFNLKDSSSKISVFKVPTKDKNKILDYEAHKEKGLRAIVIGGLALSRGLTLEGLTISYLYRNTSTFDVLMQMGRWFGYRDKPFDYESLCKIWMLDKTKEYFFEISQSIETLKEDIRRMVGSKKTPKEFGIRVRNESDSLGITNKNKMRTSKKYVYNFDYFGNVLETPFLDFSNDILEENNKVFISFVKSINLTQVDNNKLLAVNVDSSLICGILSKLNIHEANKFNYFDKLQLVDFIKKYQFGFFDVGIIGGDGDSLVISNDLSINFIKRSFDFFDKGAIRISGSHKKLGGPLDTKLGLPKDLESTLSDEKDNNKKFLVEGRNPLLLIYPIRLKFNSNYFNSDLEQQQAQSLIENSSKNNGFFIGLSLAFPRSSSISDKKEIIYVINRKTSWYNSMKKELDEENDE